MDKIKIGGEWANLPRVGEYWISDVYEDIVEITTVDEYSCETKMLFYKNKHSPRPLHHKMSIPHFLSRYEKMTKLQKYLMGIEDEA